MAPLQPGDPAPAFALLDQEGRTVRLTDFQGQKLLLFFYPKALTSGCTKQAGSVRDARAELAELGVAALGISPDPVDLQKKFAAKHAPGFPLLSDPDHAVATAYGVWGEKSMYGKNTRALSARPSSSMNTAGSSRPSIWSARSRPSPRPRRLWRPQAKCWEARGGRSMSQPFTGNDLAEEAGAFSMCTNERYLHSRVSWKVSPAYSGSVSMKGWSHEH